MPPVYSLQIQLPESLQRELRTWTAQTPGATLPAGGAHITLLHGFEPTRRRASVAHRTAEVCGTYQPFPVRLSRIVTGPHWRRPNLYGVFLMGNELSDGIRRLVQLQQQLKTVLSPMLRELQPEVTGRRYRPHVSLTWGIPAVQAVKLARAARAAHIRVEFTVERVWLLEFASETPDHEQIEHRQVFELG